MSVVKGIRKCQKDKTPDTGSGVWSRGGWGGGILFPKLGGGGMPVYCTLP